jgi:hypothetical protein
MPSVSAPRILNSVDSDASAEGDSTLRHPTPVISSLVESGAHFDPSKMKTVVAIDGPAASGKSSVAKRLSARLGFSYIDSGAFIER